MTSYPGSRTINQVLWLKAFLDSGLQYESLEGFMDFLAFLVQKLWQNKQKSTSEIHEITQPYPQWFGVFWLNLGTRNLRKSIKGSKDSDSSLEYNQTLSHNFGPLSGWWHHKRTTKKSKTYPFSNDTHRKPRTQISNVFFSVQTIRLDESFKASNSSLSCSSGELTQIEMLPVGDSKRFLILG